VTLEERQDAWREKLNLLPDPQERLSALVNRRARLEPLRADERNDGFLVPGCVSRVWLAGEVAGGRLRLRVDAEAGIVKGLANFLCELCDGVTIEDAAKFQPTLLEEVGIARMLTPTRLNGLHQVARRIRKLAGRG
jgi:cysteine desulfuration protein SufE